MRGPGRSRKTAAGPRSHTSLPHPRPNGPRDRCVHLSLHSPCRVSAVYAGLWYLAVNGRNVGPLDFCGAFGGSLGVGTRMVYVGLAVAALGVAFLTGRVRAATGRG